MQTCSNIQVLTLADGKAAEAAMIAGEIGEAVKEEILSGGAHNED